MNVKTGTETAQFPKQEHNNGFFVAVQGAHSQPRSEPETYLTAGRRANFLAATQIVLWLA